jgi:glycosyltransferase involved in cell wall biosynthesis
VQILVNASNLHIGGGKVILNDLLSATKYFNKIKFRFYIDARFEYNKFESDNISFTIIEKTKRYLVCFNIEKHAHDDDIIIYLTNIPPVIRHKCKTILFLGNRFVIDYFTLSGFSFRTKIRIYAERILFILNKNKVDYIVVQSDSMSRLLKGKGVDKNKLFISAYKQLDEDKTTANVKYQRQYEIFLYVSSDEPHKNHKNLIEAWCLLSEDNIYPKLILTIDKNTTLYSSIVKKVEKYSLNIDIMPNLERKNLLCLYKQSSVLIFPSLFESYGLPLVEANHYKLPVIASELDYVRDILDPVETFDPYSAKSISRSVKRYLKIKDTKTDIVAPVEFIKSVISL